MNPHNQVNEIIRTGVYDSLLNYRLYNVIHSFKKEFPNVKLVITNSSIPKDLRGMIRNGELDIIFQVEPPRSFADLIVTTLCEEKFKLILPKGEQYEYIQKEGQHVFLTEKNCSYRSIFERLLDEQGISKDQALEIGSVNLIKQYVGLGMGFAMIPSFALESEKDKNVLVSYDVAIPPIIHNMSIIKVNISLR